MRSMARPRRARCWRFQQAGAITFDYGNNIRAQAQEAGRRQRLRLPGLRARVHPAAVLRGQGPVPLGRALRRSGGHPRTDEAVLELFPENESLARWIRMAQEQVPFQGLPARICWLGYGERAKAGLRFNELVASGEVSAPIVIGRDHLDSGSVASPNRETEGMRMAPTRSPTGPCSTRWSTPSAGASWVSHPPRWRRGHRLFAARRHGRRRRRHGPGRAEARAGAHHRPRHGRHPPRGRRLRRAIEVARERGVRVPMLEG